MAEFVTSAGSVTKTGKGPETEKSWNVDVQTLSLSKGVENTLDLSPKNPNTPDEAPLRSPEEILKEM